MFKRSSKLTITFILTLCVLCSSFALTASAMGRPSIPDESNVGNGGVVENTEPIETTEAEKPETEPETEPKTEPQTTQRPNKPANTVVNQADKKPTTTRQEVVEEDPVDVEDDNNQDNGNEAEEPEEPEETPEEDDGLPEGSFYVYLELNNGNERRKTVLDKPGVVPEPNNPERKGYIFAGWYADPEFKTPWNFTTDFADENTVIYAKWSADPSTIVYNITVKQSKGGTIQVNPAKASAGEPVLVTVTPDEGKRLVLGSLKINGQNTDVLSFIMPAKDVVLEAKFEKIPASALAGEEEKSVLPFVIGAVVLLVAVIVILFFILRRRNQIIPVELDENGAVIIEDDDEDDWIDDSIIIEDGFKEGKIVRENVDPDFGDPDVPDFDIIDADD